MPHLETGKEKSEYGKSLTALHISVMLFGLSAVLGRFVDVPAVLVAAGRVVFSSLLLLVILLVKRAPLKLATGKDYAVALLAGAVLAVHWTTFFQSIQSASVAIGTITFSTFPLFLTFLEPLVFHEKLRLRDLISAAVLLVGVIITVPEFSMENEMTIGMIWGMVSSLSYAVLSLFNRHLCRKIEAKIDLPVRAGNGRRGTAACVVFGSGRMVRFKRSRRCRHRFDLHGIRSFFVCISTEKSKSANSRNRFRHGNGLRHRLCAASFGRSPDCS